MFECSVRIQCLHSDLGHIQCSFRLPIPAQFELASRASRDECRSWDTWPPPTQAGSTRPSSDLQIVPGGTTPSPTSS